jgi:hypothetical protein
MSSGFLLDDKGTTTIPLSSISHEGAMTFPLTVYQLKLESYPKWRKEWSVKKSRFTEEQMGRSPNEALSAEFRISRLATVAN